MFSQANAGEAWHEYPLARPRMEVEWPKLPALALSMDK